LRQAMAHLFEDAALLPRLQSVEEIAVEYGDHPISGAYLAGWLQTGLPHAKATLKHRAGTSSSVHLGGRGVDINIELGTAVLIRVDGAEYRAVLPIPGECDLMREELSILEADPVFTAAFGIAEKLAKGGA
jgi:hypothetical protein